MRRRERLPTIFKIDLDGLPTSRYVACMLDTRTKLLDSAQFLLQTRGYKGFSFGDLSEELGIKTASIHYHFPTKSDLARALLSRYSDCMTSCLANLEAKESDPGKRLQAFVKMLAECLKDGNRMCLCGMLASEMSTLPDDVNKDLTATLELVEAWIATQLKLGKERGSYNFSSPPKRLARSLFASFQGNMMYARTTGDEREFVQRCECLLDLLD